MTLLSLTEVEVSLLRFVLDVSLLVIMTLEVLPDTLGTPSVGKVTLSVSLLLRTCGALAVMLFIVSFVVAFCCSDVVVMFVGVVVLLTEGSGASGVLLFVTFEFSSKENVGNGAQIKIWFVQNPLLETSWLESTSDIAKTINKRSLLLLYGEKSEALSNL